MKNSVLASLSEYERERLLRDLGIAEEDFQGISAGRKGAEVHLPQRLQQAGLDQGDIRAKHGAVMRDMERVCSLCGEKRRCTQDLERHDEDRLAGYCPNTLTIDSLKNRH